MVEFEELYSFTKDSIVVTQCVSAGKEVLEAMLQAHKTFYEAYHQQLNEAMDFSKSRMTPMEVDRTTSRLLYHLHDFQGLMLLAKALDARIQNSITLVSNVAVCILD